MQHYVGNTRWFSVKNVAVESSIPSTTYQFILSFEIAFLFLYFCICIMLVKIIFYIFYVLSCQDYNYFRFTCQESDQ